jgi:hypothetical protein
MARPKQAPAAEEPDESEFSQHLECSMVDVSQPAGHAAAAAAAAASAPEPDQAASRPARGASEEGYAAEQDAFAHITAADVLDYREGGCAACMGLM